MTKGKRDGEKLSELLLELKNEYRKNFPKRIQVLRELTQRQDWECLTREFHKLKGTGRTYGYPEVSILCEVLEEACRQGQVDAVQMQKVFSVFARMLESWEDGRFFHPQQDQEAKEILALKGDVP
jgi:HPt (histidine-containing phosphotransfer) domain-containing protein